MNQIIRKGGRTAAVIVIILLESNAGRWTRPIAAGVDRLATVRLDAYHQSIGLQCYQGTTATDA